MRIRTFLSLAAVAGSAAVLPHAAAAQTYPTVQVATFPASPVPGDPVFVKLSGIWPDGCVPETSATVTLARSGSVFLIDLSYVGFAGGCITALTPWALDVQLAPLAEGIYTVEVTRTDAKGSRTIGSANLAVAPPANAVFWVPGFSAVTSSGTLVSTLSGTNSYSTTAVVSPVTAFDALGERTPASLPVPIVPGATASVDTSTLRPGQAVQMLEFRAPARVAFRATLERQETVPEGLPKAPNRLGRVELPVFTELFPAMLTTAAGDLSFAPDECAPSSTSRRRVNLTVFNAGRSTASVRVTAASPTGTVPGFDLSYSVPARSLVQFNALPMDGLAVCQPGGAWLRVTVDQPYLAYVSSVRPETLPGILPYEIFQAHFER